MANVVGRVLTVYPHRETVCINLEVSEGYSDMFQDVPGESVLVFAFAKSTRGIAFKGLVDMANAGKIRTGDFMSFKISSYEESTKGLRLYVDEEARGAVSFVTDVKYELNIADARKRVVTQSHIKNRDVM